MAIRTTALIVDGIIVFVGLGLVVGLLSGQGHHDGGSWSFNLHGGPALIWLVLAFGYWIVLEYAWGTTVGKRLFSIRVVDRDGGRPSFGQSLIRNLFRIADGFPYIVPYLVGFAVALSDADRQRVGDQVARTRVVVSA